MSDAQPDIDPARPHGGLRIVLGLYLEIAILAFCGLILSGTGKTEGPVYDAVGPDFLPTLVACMVAVLTLLQVIVQVVRGLRGHAEASTEQVTAGDVATGILFGLATAAYVASLAWRMAPFYLATAVFVALAAAMVSRRLDWRELATGLTVGLVLGIVLQLIFTKVLVIDLPT